MWCTIEHRVPVIVNIDTQPDPHASSGPPVVELMFYYHLGVQPLGSLTVRLRLPSAPRSPGGDTPCVPASWRLRTQCVRQRTSAHSAVARSCRNVSASSRRRRPVGVANEKP